MTFAAASPAASPVNAITPAAPSPSVLKNDRRSTPSEASLTRLRTADFMRGSLSSAGDDVKQTAGSCQALDIPAAERRRDRDKITTEKRGTERTGDIRLLISVTPSLRCEAGPVPPF